LAKIHPETALAGSNKRFELQFRKMEDMVAESGRDFGNISEREKALIWEKVKNIVR
jgi:ATP diphosphatase